MRVAADIPIYERGKDRPTGKTAGWSTQCQLSGCTGIRVYVRWEDGRWTKPCSKGMEPYEDGWRLV